MPRAWVKPSATLLIAPLVAAVLVGDELGGERVEVGLGDQLLEREDVDPALELDRHGLLVAGRGGAVVVGLLEDLERARGSARWRGSRR